MPAKLRINEVNEKKKKRETNKPEGRDRTERDSERGACQLCDNPPLISSSIRLFTPYSGN